MNFEVHGGFSIPRKANWHGDFNKSFWGTVKKKDSDLPNACGCYVFALEHGSNIVAWYVGKMEKRTFQQECFHATMASRAASGLWFWLGRRRPSPCRISKCGSGLTVIGAQAEQRQQGWAR